MSETQIPLVAKQSIGKKSRILFEKWRYAELLSSILATIGIITASVDYEMRYSSDRSEGNWAQNEITELPRFITMILTVWALIYVIIRHMLKKQWVDHIAPAVPLVRPDKTKIVKQFSEKRGYLTLGICFDIFILLLFPYPWTEADVRLNETQAEIPDFKQKELCYTLGEILYVCMYLRIYFLVRAIFNYTLYQDNHARYCCSIFGVRANLRFSIKCMIKRYPLLIIMAIVVPSFFICGIILRVFERPYEFQDHMNFDSLWNSIWCVTITMATIGYGDIYPSTNLGRTVAIFCAFWGAFAFSMLVVTLEKTFTLTRYQGRAYVTINRSREAAAVVQASLQYWLELKFNGYNKQSPVVSEKFKILRKKLRKFSQEVHKQEELFTQREEAIIMLKQKVHITERNLHRLRSKFDELEGLLENSLEL